MVRFNFNVLDWCCAYASINLASQAFCHRGFTPFVLKDSCVGTQLGRDLAERLYVSRYTSCIELDLAIVGVDLRVTGL